VLGHIDFVPSNTESPMRILSLPALLILPLVGCDDGSSSPSSSSCDDSALTEPLAAMQVEIDSLQAEVAALSAVDLTDLTSRIDQNTSDIAVLDGRVAATEGAADAAAASIAASDARVATIEDDFLTSADLDGLAAESWVTAQGYITTSALSGYASAASVDTIDARVDALESVDTSAMEDLLSYVDVDTSADTVKFVGANVDVQSGYGATGDTSSGLGNLIVGYDEDSSDTKTGAHNLVVGIYHTYTGVGAIMGGYGNEVSGNYSVVFGQYNIVSGVYAGVTGGYSNTASGSYASISAGRNSEASGYFAAVSGGGYNDASGSYSTITGGYNNDTSTTWDVSP
jgi:hypothetical protein